MEKINKINTYINFSIKSGNCIFGVDNILKTKSVQIILYNNSLSENSINKLRNRFKNILIIQIDEVFELFADKNIKVLAINNKNLAEAIKEILSQKGYLEGITVE